MNRSKSKPLISAPVLLSTTLNPNDADAHRNVSFAMRKSASVSSSLSSSTSSSSNTRLSFKDLSKRLSAASSLFSSLTSPSKELVNPLNKSSFYVAEAIYEAEGSVAVANSEENSLTSSAELPSDSRQSSPDHIYETIPDPAADDDSGDQQHRPLPPIPEEKRRQGRRRVFSRRLFLIVINLLAI